MESSDYYDLKNAMKNRYLTKDFLRYIIIIYKNERVLLMDLSAIKKGDRISNYRALCKLLGEDEKNGYSKRAQIKTWEQYFSFEREKNAFIITEIYDVPKIKSDDRMTFMKYSVPLFLHYLAHCSRCRHLSLLSHAFTKISR